MAEEMVMQLEAKNKQLTEALYTRDKDLSQSSATKAYAEKVMAELKAQSKKTGNPPLLISIYNILRIIYYSYLFNTTLSF